MREKKVIPIINLVSFIFLLVASFVFVRNGNMFNTQEVMPLFMPAPYAFSIWILIYILLGIWVIFGFFAQKENRQMYEEVGGWFALCMILTALTLLVPVEWSPIIIIGALITALVVYLKVKASNVSKLFIIPFSFLTAWLSVATIANISLVLKMMGQTEIFGINEMGWAILMLAVSAMIGVLFGIGQEDSIYPLVFIWGYIAIAVQDRLYPSIVKMAISMCVVMIIVIGYNIYKKIDDKQRI